MNELRLFTNEEFGRVRTVMINDEPCFAGVDIAKALEFKNPHDALKNHVDSEDKGIAKHDTLGGEQNLVFINESGLYSLVFGSKKESAKRFKRWITKDVIPEIRKTGKYEHKIELPQTYAEALRELADKAEENERLQLENKEMKPKALFADAVETADTSILVGALAKMIRQNGYEIGQNRLFAWMRDKGYLMKNGEDYNMPTQYSMDLGLMEIKERSIVNADGSVRITKITKVTGKGQQYFVNKFLGGN